jgi:hypothetical protein
LAEEIPQGGGKVFLYYFTYLDIGEYNSEAPTLGLRLGADHGAELPYVFGLLNHWSTPVPEKRPQAASRCDGLLDELCYDYGSERRRFAQVEITREVWEHRDEHGPERGYASSSACITARFLASSLGEIIRPVGPELDANRWLNNFSLFELAHRKLLAPILLRALGCNFRSLEND